MDQAEYPSTGRDWKQSSMATGRPARTSAAARGLSHQRRQLADQGRELQRRRRIHRDVHRALAAAASSDFKVKTLDGVADDWPIDYVRSPRSSENDRMMGVSGLSGDPLSPLTKPPMPHSARDSPVR